MWNENFCIAHLLFYGKNGILAMVRKTVEMV